MHNQTTSQGINHDESMPVQRTVNLYLSETIVNIMFNDIYHLNQIFKPGLECVKMMP